MPFAYFWPEFKIVVMNVINGASYNNYCTFASTDLLLLKSVLRQAQDKLATNKESSSADDQRTINDKLQTINLLYGYC
jgi:hypothetical protein